MKRLIMSFCLATTVLFMSCGQGPVTKIDYNELFRISDEILNICSLVNNGSYTDELVNSKLTHASDRYDKFVDSLSSEDKRLSSVVLFGSAIDKLESGLVSGNPRFFYECVKQTVGLVGEATDQVATEKGMK